MICYSPDVAASAPWATNQTIGAGTLSHLLTIQSHPMGCQVLGSAKGRHRTPAHWGVMKQPECEKRSPTSSKRIAQRRSSQTDDRVRKSTLTEQILPAGKTMCDATAQGKQVSAVAECQKPACTLVVLRHRPLLCLSFPYLPRWLAKVVLSAAGQH